MLSPITSYLSPKNHNPSIARKISRELKRGAPPESVLNLARTINDSYYRSLSFVSIASSIKGKKSKELFEEAISNLERVKQAWRRVELLGEITKILKRASDDVKKNIMFERTLTLLKNEKGENAKEFFVKYSKNYPDEMFEPLLNKSLSLKNYEFESSKAVIRIWIKRKPVDHLVSNLSKVKGELRPRLLGYLHFQLNKSGIQTEPTPLSLALQSPNTEDILKYLVRICSTSSDLNEIAKVSASSPGLMLALTARADRKGFSKEAENFVDKAESLINSLKSSNKKDKLLQKLKQTKDRLHVEDRGSPKSVSELPEIGKAGNHTLGLFNTYSGKWNHPHFKAIHKAAILCSAFDLDLALIGFPLIDKEKLIKEIKKEMRLPNEGYLSSLFSKNRVRFFETDIDESWAGSKVATTANPDANKISIPDGKLCMIMGLGPKGLPKTFLESSPHHFELTGSNVAFETGTAMGSIAGRLSLM